MAPAEGARSVTGTPVAARRRPPGIVGVVLTTTLLPDVECHEMTVTKRGRPPIGAVAMTATERKRAQRARERGGGMCWTGTGTASGRSGWRP